MALNDLVAPDSSLGAVTALLRQNASHGDQANLLNLYNLLDHLQSYDELIRLKRRRMPPIDSNNMQVSSLMHIPLEAICFGDGPVFGNKGSPESMRLLMEASNSFTRTCLVLPRNKKSGGAEVLVGLYDEELDSLLSDEEFTSMDGDESNLPPQLLNPSYNSPTTKKQASSSTTLSESEGDLYVETEGAVGAKYMYRLDLSLRSAGRSASSRNNKLVWRGFWSYNRLTDDWAQFTLKNDKPFFFSRVKSYGVGE
ncbi:hypothetical protein ONZ43_g3602 [Nemania bipapillata]|uniref:Uncharacterized protein n=1 Tax=Nemania bipapillata TaxID=110536 RepID=A0ACC2IWG5_9PEZI|nr:hypothetical protein ONZ43_g3602 [Nemania bipapillata]